MGADDPLGDVHEPEVVGLRDRQLPCPARERFRLADGGVAAARVALNAGAEILGPGGEVRQILRVRGDDLATLREPDPDRVDRVATLRRWVADAVASGQE
jgi:hypothetical protein